MRMTRAPYLVTLFSGDATRDIAYGPDGLGGVRRLDETGWDGPVERPIERARVELKIEGKGTIAHEIAGPHYLGLEEAGAIEGLLASMARGRKPHLAVEYALLAAAV